MPICGVAIVWFSFLILQNTIDAYKSTINQNYNTVASIANDIKGPVLLHDNGQPHMHTTNTSKVTQIGLQSFASSSDIYLTSHQSTATFLGRSWQNLFWGKMLPQPAGHIGKMLSGEFVKSWSTDSNAKYRKTYFFCWQSVRLQQSIWLTKMFDAIAHDLKSRPEIELPLYQPNRKSPITISE